jgi:GntR family transcriptional regulator
MQVFINHKSGVPAWRQIVNQVKNLVAAGALESGDRLPSVRTLAKELGVNPITTARAYRELESEGVAETRQGAGTFIGSKRVRLSHWEVLRRLKPMVDELLVNSKQMGMSQQALLDLLEERYAALFKDGGRARKREKK